MSIWVAAVLARFTLPILKKYSIVQVNENLKLCWWGCVCQWNSKYLSFNSITSVLYMYKNRRKCKCPKKFKIPISHRHSEDTRLIFSVSVIVIKWLLTRTTCVPSLYLINGNLHFSNTTGIVTILKSNKHTHYVYCVKNYLIKCHDLEIIHLNNDKDSLPVPDIAW